MLNFDSFTLIPAYSDIASRNEVDISININDTKSELPIINANMLSICSIEMLDILSNKYKTFSSYHRFFENIDAKKQKILNILDYIDDKNISKFWMSIGTKIDDYEFADWLIDKGINNLIIDVNHGFHKAVGDILQHLRKNYKNLTIMAGNVSDTNGIIYLLDNGADIIKCGNSYGNSCSTQKMTGFGVHPLHVIKTYREETENWDSYLCADGGIRHPDDIAKCLIWGNMVMLGSMLAGSDESFGTKIFHDGFSYKEFFGNASTKTKQVASEDNHIRFVEGVTKLVPFTGPLSLTLDNIVDGVKSAFSFVGARNLEEFQNKAINQILYV